MARLTIRAAAFAVLTVAVAALAARESAGHVLARRSPALAIQLDSGNPRALGKLLDRKLTSGAKTLLITDGDIAEVRHALQSSTLHAPLLRQLGIGRELSRDGAGAKRAVELAERISRRDQFTQLWLIEAGVRQNRIAEALHHYDVALTTSDTLEPLLFPILANALDDLAIRMELAEQLKRQRFWTRAFMAHAQSSAPPAAVASLITSAGLTSDTRLLTDMRELLHRFAARGDVAGAKAFAANLPGSRPQLLEKAGFNQATLDQNFAPLSWQLTDDADIRAEPIGKHRLGMRVAADVRGVAATRILQVAPGPYRLVFAASTPEGAQPVALGWTVTCLRGTSSQAVGSQTYPSARGTQSFSFVVPERCSGIRLELAVRSDEGAAGEVEISELDLQRFAAPTG